MDERFRRIFEEHERIRRLIKPSTVEMIRQLDSDREMLRTIANPPALEQLRKIQENAKIIDQTQEYLKTFERLQNNIDSAFQGYRSVWDQINNTIRVAPLSGIDALERANSILDRNRDVSWPSKRF